MLAIRYLGCGFSDVANGCLRLGRRGQWHRRVRPIDGRPPPLRFGQGWLRCSPSDKMRDRHDPSSRCSPR